MRKGAVTKVPAGFVEQAMTEHPDVRVILDLAQRAREVEAMILPINLDAAGELTATEITSQVPAI